MEDILKFVNKISWPYRTALNADVKHMQKIL